MIDLEYSENLSDWGYHSTPCMGMAWRNCEMTIVPADLFFFALFERSNSGAPRFDFLSLASRFV